MAIYVFSFKRESYKKRNELKSESRVYLKYTLCAENELKDVSYN